MAILKNIKFFKNIFITTGITFIFGIYSIFQLYIYLNQIDNKINNLKKKEIHHKQLELEILKIKNNIDILSDRIIELEKNNTILNKNDVDINDVDINDVIELVNSNKYLSNFEDIEYIEDIEEIKEIKEIKKIGDFTCINMDEIANQEKDSDEDSIKSVRSRSSSLNWVKKTLFG